MATGFGRRVLGVAVVAAVAGCSHTTTATVAPTSASAATPGVSSTTATPQGSLSAPTSAPAATSSVQSGDLTAANLPQPSAIGTGWKANNSPDGTEGTAKPSWLTSRNPVETNTGLVPLGCSGLTAIPRYPVAQHVLQGRYEAGSLNAVVIVLEYGSAATATSFMTTYTASISHCPAPAKVTATTPYTRAITTSAASDTRIRDSWVEYGANAGTTVWWEVLLRTGSRVGLCDVEARPGQPPDMGTAEAALRNVLAG